MKKLLHPVSVVAAIAAIFFSPYISDAQHRNLYKVQPVLKRKAFAFDNEEVKLLPGSPFSTAMKTNAAYLLSLSADRFLHRWRTNAGLAAKAPLYDGWEQTSSHMLGHYLSALVLAYAGTGDRSFLTRSDYIVDELDEIQRARGSGYIGGIPGEDTLWQQVAAGKIVSGGFDLNGAWVPWYMLHKVWAGLLDAFFYTKNEKAKDVVIRLSDWAYEKFFRLPDSTFQKMMIAEFGGMNESLAEVYAITGNKKYLDLSYKFYHRQVMDPLSRREDKLGGQHANTQIPKILGAARQFELTGNKRDSVIASFFFDAVIKNHSYVNGGNSNYESFNYPGRFSNALSTNTAETCNTYNMLKLDKQLFTWQPSAALADYYERALYNHILASQHPQTGMLTYYMSLQSGTQKVYSTADSSFWCCVGTGIENHSKYGEGIYFKDPDGGLYINLFIPSELTWKEKQVVIRQENNFPYEAATTLTVLTKRPVNFQVHLRTPSWSKSGMGIFINGKRTGIKTTAGTYATIQRIWKNQDKIELRFDMQLYTESMQDNVSKKAIFFGPLLMAGIIGRDIPGVMDVPVLVTEDKPVDEWIKIQDKKRLVFTTKAGKPSNVPVVPFYSIHDQRYVVYWDLFTEKEWEVKKTGYEKELKRLADIETRTIDIVRFGDQQSEKDHALTGINTGVGSHMDRKFRDAPNGGWFSFTLKVSGGQLQLLNTYNGGDGGNRVFEIYIDGIKIAKEELKGDHPGIYVEKEYSIPEILIKGKDKVTIRFQGLPGNIAGAFFESRIIKTP